MEETKDLIQIKSDKKKIIFFILLFLLLIIFGVLGVLSPSRFVYFFLPSKEIVFVFSLFILIFIPYVLCYFMSFFSEKLIISKEGLYNGVYFLKRKKILWEEIDYIRPMETKYEKRIKIQLKNPKEFIENENIIMKLLMKWEIINNGTPVFINPFLLIKNNKEICLVLQKYTNKINCN